MGSGKLNIFRYIQCSLLQQLWQIKGNSKFPVAKYRGLSIFFLIKKCSEFANGLEARAHVAFSQQQKYCAFVLH